MCFKKHKKYNELFLRFFLLTQFFRQNIAFQKTIQPFFFYTFLKKEKVKVENKRIKKKFSTDKNNYVHQHRLKSRFG
jgi:hypothetical protein